MKINAAIIGLGNIGLKYDLRHSKSNIFTHARAFEMHSSFKLIAAADPSLKARKDFEKNYSSPSFKTAKDLISKLQPNIISIATPTDSHLSILKEIIEVDSLKSVLMEKPLAKSFTENSNLIVFGGISTKKQVRDLMKLSSVVGVGIGNFLNYKEHSVDLFKGNLRGNTLRD
jgi:predicted dehydrogenase